MTIKLANGTFTVTDEQISKIKAVQASKRLEALYQVAEILNKPITETNMLGIVNSGKKIYIDKTTIADITYSKGKVKVLEFWDMTNSVFVDIKIQ